LLDLSRSSIYYEPEPLFSDEQLAILNQMDEIFTDKPFYGYRRVYLDLIDQGFIVGRDRVLKYMRVLPNVAALEYYGCCPKAIVPDNLKSGVAKACRYEPDINPTYAEFAEHYGLVIFPVRPYRPKDKAKAENTVRLAKRWILAKLRNRIFYSLSELNVAITELLEKLNKLMQRIGKIRSIWSGLRPESWNGQANADRRSGS